jgi:hypothetical protein
VLWTITILIFPEGPFALLVIEPSQIPAIFDKVGSEEPPPQPIRVKDNPMQAKIFFMMISHYLG